MHLRDCGDQGCRGTRSLKLLDQVICNKGFMKLLSLGKQRFSSLRSAVINGQPCPMDNRFFPQLPKAQTEKRAAIHDFLHGLYEQAAESLPDLHHSSSNKRPRRGQFRYDEKSMDKKKLRWLPPGKIMDYLRLCRAENPDLVISTKLFSSVRAS